MTGAAPSARRDLPLGRPRPEAEHPRTSAGARLSRRRSRLSRSAGDPRHNATVRPAADARRSDAGQRRGRRVHPVAADQDEPDGCKGTESRNLSTSRGDSALWQHPVWLELASSGAFLVLSWWPGLTPRRSPVLHAPLRARQPRFARGSHKMGRPAEPRPLSPGISSAPPARGDPRRRLLRAISRDSVGTAATAAARVRAGPREPRLGPAAVAEGSSESRGPAAVDILRPLNFSPGTRGAHERAPLPSEARSARKRGTRGTSPGPPRRPSSVNGTTHNTKTMEDWDEDLFEDGTVAWARPWDRPGGRRSSSRAGTRHELDAADGRAKWES